MRTLPLAALLAAAGCHRSPAPVAGEPEQVFDGLEMSQSASGKAAWSLESRRAVLTDGDKIARLTEPRVGFFEDGKPVSKIESRSGVLRTDTHDLTLSSSVVVNSLEDGSVLRTSELHYSSERRIFHTDKPVEITNRRGVSRGEGLEAKPDLSEIKLIRQKTTIKDG